MISIPTLLAPVLLVATRVAAHGYANQIIANGKTYIGNDVDDADANAPSPIFKVVTNFPVQPATSPFLACGNQAKKATINAPITAGSTMSIKWIWPHEEGPIMNYMYMASCNGPCDKFDFTKAAWFKIQETGAKKDGTWAVADIKAGKPYKLSIPKELKAGDYLLRHEIIALHNGGDKGGAEFYPQCMWLTVRGDGTGVPKATDLQSFPGAYRYDDPGIWVRKLWSGSYKLSTYQFPGKPIVKLDSGSASGPATQPQVEPVTTITTHVQTKTPQSVIPTKVMHVVNPQPNLNESSSRCGSESVRRRRRTRRSAADVR